MTGSIAHITYTRPSEDEGEYGSGKQTHISICRNPMHNYRICSIGSPEVPIVHCFLSPSSSSDDVGGGVGGVPLPISYGNILYGVVTHVCNTLGLDLDAFRERARWVVAAPSPVTEVGLGLKAKLVEDGIETICANEIQVVGELDAAAKAMVRGWGGEAGVLAVGMKRGGGKGTGLMGIGRGCVCCCGVWGGEGCECSFSLTN
jgi:hypothetical protein